MKTPFTKMQGLGNDFIVIEGPLAVTKQQVARYCDRHLGIGADGFLVVTPLIDGRVEMKYRNADGSIAEMCGNGIRCVARFAIDRKMVESSTFTVQTLAGDLKVWERDSTDIEAQIGKPQYKKNPLILHETTFYEVNMGNPHAITFVEDIDIAPVQSLGPTVEADRNFPNKTNVEFVQIMSPTHLRMRVWERGDGETLACGTAMAASAMAAVCFKSARFPIEVEMPGGTAKIWLDKDGYCRIIGPAVSSFDGELEH